MVKRFGLMLRQWWENRSWKRKIYDIVLYGFALAGVAIIGVWLLYQTGITNNHGAIDKNYRYLMSVEEMKGLKDKQLSNEELSELWAEQYAKLIAYSRFYPANARLITQAAQQTSDPMMVDRMIAATELYIDDVEGYHKLSGELIACLKKTKQRDNGLAVPWMNTVEWESLRMALVRDQALIEEAGRLTGVEPRMIAACLVGEQIRLFNTKREMVKKYLGPMKALSVQSQFSYGVNGIKLMTASRVEENLKDPTSEFYMGADYEHLLDFETEDHDTERYNRLVDYRNHLYSYIYTGCILHQTMLQWKRAGFDISGRPDILFTLFNVGFEQSKPKADPVCGGSRIKVDEEWYTFGAIGFDFYYSGELVRSFPYWPERFLAKREQKITLDDVEALQNGVSNCRRPARGVSQDSTDDADGYWGIPSIPSTTSGAPELATPPAPASVSGRPMSSESAAPAGAENPAEAPASLLQ